jgi:transglutaminase-like putative cysteine protease
MYKDLKSVLALLLTAVILIGASGNVSIAYAKAADEIVDISEISTGVITINNQSKDKVSKVRVINDKVIYTYDYKNAMKIPLQSGNGVYQVILYSLVGGTKYKQVAIEEVEYNADDGVSVYLQSNQMVNWNENMKAIKKAADLTEGLKSDSKKVAAIYNYIVSNYQYDNEKAKSVQSGYIPEVDDVFRNKKGICYDYSVLFAAMLRSVGIPAKVLMGTSTNVDGYHAWNQVYLNGKWITVDTTVDAGLGNKTQSSMEKKSNQYAIEKQY